MIHTPLVVDVITGHRLDVCKTTSKHSKQIVRLSI